MTACFQTDSFSQLENTRAVQVAGVTQLKKKQQRTSLDVASGCDRSANTGSNDPHLEEGKTFEC